MIFKLEKASAWGWQEDIEINTLDDLISLYKKYGHDLIINFNDKVITIYDYYIE